MGSKLLLVTAAFTSLLAIMNAMVATAGPVVLSNGDVLDALRVERSEEGWIIEHAVLGTLVLEADRVARVGPEPAPVAPVAAEPAARSAADRDAGIFGTGWLEGFQRSFSVGVSGARGNSENVDLPRGSCCGWGAWPVPARPGEASARKVSEAPGYQAPCPVHGPGGQYILGNR